MVIVILGIILLIASPKFLSHIKKAEEIHIRNDVKIAEEISMSELTKVDIRYNNIDFESEINKDTHDKLIDKLNDNYRY